MEKVHSQSQRMTLDTAGGRSGHYAQNTNSTSSGEGVVT